MPRIEAATVAEHHARVETRLVDAAEQLLRAGEPLTAGAVSAAAGIARNSIYRYVDSVEDLRGMVIARYLPAWVRTVEEALAAASSPGERVVVWVRTNLAEASAAGHDWLRESMQDQVAPATTEEVDAAHLVMRDTLSNAWLELMHGDAERAGIAASLTLGILEGGFRQLDRGTPLATVSELAERASASLVAGLT